MSLRFVRLLSTSPWRAANTYAEHADTLRKSATMVFATKKDAWAQVREEVKHQGVADSAGRNFRESNNYALHVSQGLRENVKQTKAEAWTRAR